MGAFIYSDHAPAAIFREQGMGKIYPYHKEKHEARTRYCITVTDSRGCKVEEEVSEELFLEIEALQQELWRHERSEQRHTVHIEMMDQQVLLCACQGKSPEQILIDQMTSSDIEKALNEIPSVQKT